MKETRIASTITDPTTVPAMRPLLGPASGVPALFEVENFGETWSGEVGFLITDSDFDDNVEGIVMFVGKGLPGVFKLHGETGGALDVGPIPSFDTPDGPHAESNGTQLLRLGFVVMQELDTAVVGARLEVSSLGSVAGVDKGDFESDQEVVVPAKVIVVSEVAEDIDLPETVVEINIELLWTVKVGGADVVLSYEEIDIPKVVEVLVGKGAVRDVLDCEQVSNVGV